MISRLTRKISRTWQVMRRKGNRGYCSICERQVYFEIEGPWLRDQYKCVNCQSIPRWRALMLVVAELYPKWRELKIHESSPGGRSACFWCSCVKLQYPAAATCEQEDVVAMGLRATLAQSDISMKLTITAKAFSGSVRSDNFAFTMQRAT